MRKQDMPWALDKAGHILPVGAKLPWDSRVGHDDAGDSGAEVRPDEHRRRSSGTSAIVDRDTEETNADRMIRVVSGIKEASISTV
jgi:hypothetical protein